MRLRLTAHTITLWPRLSCLLCVCLSIPTLFCSLLANVYLLCVSGALCIRFSTLSVCCALQLLCCTAVPTACFSCGLYNILIWAGQRACQRHSAVCWYAIVCLKRRVDVDVGLEQVRRGCMVSAGIYVLTLCILVPFGGSGK